MPGLPPIFHRTQRALPSGQAPAPAAVPKKPLEGGNPAISAPTDPRKQPNGPNQLAGLLDRAPSQLKADTLHLQDRPQAFREGSAPTRMINGKQVAISAPMMGMKMPGENAIARRESSPGGSPHAPGQPSNRPALMGDQPSGRLAIEAPPRRTQPSDYDTRLSQEGLPSTFSPAKTSKPPAKPPSDTIAEPRPTKPLPDPVTSMELVPFKPDGTVSGKTEGPADPRPGSQSPKPPSDQGAPPKLSRAEQNFQSMHLYQNNVQFTQHVHVRPPAGQPQAPPRTPAHGHAQQGAAKPNGPRDPHAKPTHDAGDGEKKMGTGKKILIGVAAAAVLTFILPMFGSSSTPPPDGHA